MIVLFIIEDISLETVSFLMKRSNKVKIEFVFVQFCFYFELYLNTTNCCDVSHENMKAFAGTDVPHPQGGITRTGHDPENKSNKFNWLFSLVNFFNAVLLSLSLLLSSMLF